MRNSINGGEVGQFEKKQDIQNCKGQLDVGFKLRSSGIALAPGETKRNLGYSAEMI